MKNYPHIKSKRGFVRERRKHVKALKKAIWGVRCGCAIRAIYGDDTTEMLKAVNMLNMAFNTVDSITKKLAK